MRSRRKKNRFALLPAVVGAEAGTEVGANNGDVAHVGRVKLLSLCFGKSVFFEWANSTTDIHRHGRSQSDEDKSNEEHHNEEGYFLITIS